MGVLKNVSLFSGVGGMDLSAKWTGRIRTVCYVENDRYAQAVLQSRIRDGGLDDAPIWDDVSSFPAEQFKGADIVSGGFPCQDVSVAGKKEGIEEGTRSGLFYQLIRICSVIRPRFILLENVAGLLIHPGAHRVFGQLADLGCDAGWKIISASDVGAPHRRQRIWIVAYTTGEYAQRLLGARENGGTQVQSRGLYSLEGKMGRGTWDDLFSEPKLLRIPNGPSTLLDRKHIEKRNKRAGNGVCPQQALPAWEEILRLHDA